MNTMNMAEFFNGMTLGDIERGGGFAIFDEDMRERKDHIVVVVSQNRESDVLDKSNYAHVRGLYGLEDGVNTNDSKTVIDGQFGHPLVGWINYLMVDIRDEVAAKIAREVIESLRDYPVLDEDDYSEREEEEKASYVNSETPSMTANMPEGTTDEERNQAAWYGRERHEKVGGPVEDYDTEANFAYGIARVLIAKGESSFSIIEKAISYPVDNLGEIYDEAIEDHQASISTIEKEV